MIKVTIYNEFYHEQNSESIKAIYPEGMHRVIADALECDDIRTQCFTLDNVGEITDEVLDNTDVLIWWGHMKHGDVPDEVAERVQNAVLKGMGFVVLHSGHHSKPFKRLMGTTCNLSWREHGDMERVWVINPAHPIAQGIDRYFELEHEEMYGEPFGIPEPDQLVFTGWYEGGEVFRSGCCWFRENGKIFYFQPGHESYPTYYNEDVQRIIKNAVYWAAPTYRAPVLACPQVKKIGE